VPSILVETSPERHQGFWFLESPQQPTDLEAISKQVTYSIPDADHSGWSLGHRMRVPNTYNHKYSSGPKPVKVISASLEKYASLKLPDNTIIDLDLPLADEWQPTPLIGHGPRELWLRIKPSLPRRVQAAYDLRQQDRSAALWALMLALFRQGLSRDQVFWIAQASANNKWKDNRFHADLDLAKDVFRAERAVVAGIDDGGDVLAKINDARRMPGAPNERRAYLAHIVKEAMAAAGTFVSADDGQDWYIRSDTGRPILLTRSSEYLNSLLETRFGLNAVEPEQRYVINNLLTSAKETGLPGLTSALSHYDKPQNVVLLHTGRRDVLRIDNNKISTQSNGHLNVVFPWRLHEEPFSPDINNPLSIDRMFDECFDNLNDMPSNEALALVKSWLYFLFFRDAARARPILALLGQPGSGKTALFNRIYTLLYGPEKAINTITTADNFDSAVSSNPLVVFDGVDSWVGWLPDKLSLSAGVSVLEKRKLYTDNDAFTVRRQAMVGITAHNPKFRREDIIDRMIILSFHRFKIFKPSTEIIAEMVTNRNRLWGGIVNDLQLILNTPIPTEEELPRFRISDFARFGLWFARALNYEDDFVAALKTNVHEQTSFNLEEEDALVDTIRVWIQTKYYDPTRYYKVSELWTAWQANSRDPTNFMRQYRNAVMLGKKLWTLQETLNSVFEVEFESDLHTSSRVWRIQPK